MSDLREKVALTLFNKTPHVETAIYGTEPMFEHLSQQDKELLFDQSQLAIDKVCEALLSDEVMKIALNVYWNHRGNSAEACMKAALTAAVEKLRGE